MASGPKIILSYFHRPGVFPLAARRCTVVPTINYAGPEREFSESPT